MRTQLTTRLIATKAKKAGRTANLSMMLYTSTKPGVDGTLDNTGS